MASHSENKLNSIFTADTGARGLAFLLDSILVLIPYVLIVGPQKVISEISNNSFSQLGIIVICVSVFVYNVAFLFWKSATPGKLVVGIRVVPAHAPELRLSVRSILLRVVLGPIASFLMFLSYGVALSARIVGIPSI
jgi:uncharacterized RDD family membrane protein YckC